MRCVRRPGLRALVTAVVSLWLASACRPPEAPEELNDLSRYLYRTWDDPDERVPAAGLANLQAFLEAIPLTREVGLDDRAWELALLEPGDVAAITRPDRPLGNLIGIGQAFASEWPVDCHVQMQMRADQLPVEPSATDYTRTFEAATTTCFASQDCDVIETVNEVRRSNPFLSVWFTLYKNFRWVTFEAADGSERIGMYSRSWLDQSWPGENDVGMMWQSYSIDVWLPQEDGTAWRYQTLWTETELSIGVDNGIQLGTIKGSTDGAMFQGDEAIGELIHDAGQ